MKALGTLVSDPAASREELAAAPGRGTLGT